MNKIKKNPKTIFMFRNFFYWKNITIGLFTGVICGLFTSGGGMILVPAFIYVLNMGEVEARSTSVMCILPLVVTSGIFYYKNNYIDWKIGILCAIGGILGGIVGSKMLRKIPVKYLRILFIVFLVYSSIKTLK